MRYKNLLIFGIKKFTYFWNKKIYLFLRSQKLSCFRDIKYFIFLIFYNHLELKKKLLFIYLDKNIEN